MKRIAFSLMMLTLLVGTAVTGCPNGGDGNGDGYTPPSFSVSNLSVEPTEVGLNETVTISVSVTNTGGSQGSHNVVLNIDGVQEAIETVTIAAGGSQSVTFSVTRGDAETYAVTIGSLSGSFTVISTELSEGLIAFASDRDGDFEIYTMNADGSNVVKLTDNTTLDEKPSWSPDGQRITYK